jgi:hypothetical protein
MQANTGLALGPSLRSKNSTNQPPKAGGFFISLEEPTCKTKKTISDRTGEKTMTKNEIVKTIRSFAKDNGRNPSIRDITYKTKVTRHFIYEQFGSWRKALAGAGLKAGGPGMAQPESALMLDWAAATRKLGKIPSVYEYERAGRFSNVPFQTRYRRWKDVPEAFAKFARKDGVDQEWWDVLAIIEGEKASLALQPGKGRRSQKEIVLRDRANLWRSAGAAGAGIRAGERSRSGVCLWHGGAQAGVHGAQDTDGVSRLRGHAQSGARAVAAGAD